MVILLYAVELDVLEGLEAPGRSKVMDEAAAAYRERARALGADSQAERARADLRRAEKMEAEAKKLADGDAKATSIADLTRRIQELQKELDRILAESGRKETGQRSAKFPPDAGLVRIELVNDWTSAVTVIVDGTSYALAPGDSRVLRKPAGSFTYEVRDVQGPTTRTLAAGEKFTIRIADRR
jgi:hypothetical protein